MGTSDAFSTTTISVGTSSLAIARRQRGNSSACWSQTGMTAVRAGASAASRLGESNTGDVERNGRLGRVRLELGTQDARVVALGVDPPRSPCSLDAVAGRDGVAGDVADGARGARAGLDEAQRDEHGARLGDRGLADAEPAGELDVGRQRVAG